MTSSAREFRQGLLDVLPILVAATPIGLLWGTLAASKGLVPFKVWLMSATVFAGAAQFVAIEVWRDQVPLGLADGHGADRQHPPCVDGGIPVPPPGRHR